MPQPHTPVQTALFSMRDEAYKLFHAKLIPDVNPELVIGVRTPFLRRFAAEFAKTPEASEFLSALPHVYYEENNLHAFLIEKIRDFEETLAALDKFLPYVDNWATCDMMSPPVFRKHKHELLCKIREWIASGEVYTVRFGLGMLQKHYLDDGFKEEYLDLAASVRSDEYYINMMIAWFFATALAKQYDAALPYLEAGALDVWTHNKAIQKARESFRVPAEHKAHLVSLKR